MLRNIHLFGDLADHCGGIETHRFDVKSTGEAMRALEVNYPGFRNKIKRDEKYFVVCGEVKEENALDDQTIFMNFHKGDFYISPEIGGSKSMFGAIATAVLGAVLMVVSIWVPPAGALGYGLLTKGFVFAVGLSLFASGILGAISPPAKIGDYGEREDAEAREGYLFDGPTNTTEQGGPVPLLYGRVLAGSILISSALDVEDF